MKRIVLLLLFIGQSSGTCYYNDPNEDCSGPQYRFGCEATGGCWTWCNEGRGWCFTGMNCTSYQECNIHQNCVGECFPNEENDHGPLKFRYDCGKGGKCWTWCLQGTGWCYTDRTNCLSYKDCNIDDQCVKNSQSQDQTSQAKPKWMTSRGFENTMKGYYWTL